MKPLYTFLTVVALVWASQAQAQFQNILVGNMNSPQEPSIMINPKNVAQMVAGANMNNVYVSTDTGNTWQHQILSSTYGVWGDPVIVVDTTEDFYFLHLSAPSNSYLAPDWLDRIVCQRLDTINGMWNNGSFTGLNGTADQDKEWAVVDRKTNTIYMTWTQFDLYGSTNPFDSSVILFSKTTDKANTWSTPVRINQVAGICLDDDATVEGAVPAVGPNGEVYVCWTGPAGIRFDRSLDGGQTWLDNDIHVADMPGGWDFNVPGIFRCNGLPFMSCDLSGGPNHGTIYINWSDQRNGTNNTDVWLAKSTDGGTTWSAPIMVNNDNTIAAHQFFNSMTIDQSSGYLYFVFYDRRNHTNNQTDVYMAYSTDGGATIHNRKISASPFTPLSTVFFGDYTYISAHNGVIRPIWGRMNGGALSIWTAKVDTASLFQFPAAIEDVKVELGESYPNPFYETTFLSFKMKEQANVQLDVMDLYGRKITTILNNELLGHGKHTYQFKATDFDLSPGIYFFHLRVGNQVKTRKIVLAN